MTKISAMSQDTAPTTTDYFPTIDAETGNNKRVTIADLITLLKAQMLPAGAIQAYGGKTAPTGWQLCYGQAISRSTYADMFAAIVPLVGTFTVTLASPGIFTLTSHGLNTGDSVYLTTTGALPTGLTANTLYYVTKLSSDTFKLATTRANAVAGTNINTSGSQSGTHSLRFCPFGLGDGSTTFNVPDLRGRVPAGNDYMGGVAASRLALTKSEGVSGNMGATGGEEAHTISSAEMPSHNHSLPNGGTGNVANNPGSFFNAQYTNGTAGATASATGTGSAGSGGSHNNVQPTQITNFIIKE